MRHLRRLAVPALLFVAYAAGVYFPYRPTRVRLDPKPWPKIHYYETPPVEGWQIESSIGGNYRLYKALFPLSIQEGRVKEILGRLISSVPAFKQATSYASIEKIIVETNDGTSWEEVDQPLADALRMIKGNPNVNLVLKDQALARAVNSWSKALGRTIPTPTVYRGQCGGWSIYTVACAHDGYIVVEDFYSTDPYSIYLHEIGHLLGVKHIPGDPLMEADYSGPVAGPTKAAIAAALHPKVD